MLWRSNDASATGIRLTDDPAAPMVRGLDLNKTHPYQQKEALGKINKELKGKKTVNSHDIQCIRKVHQVDPPSIAPQRRCSWRKASMKS